MLLRILFCVVSFGCGVTQAQLKLHGTAKDADGTAVMAVVYTTDFKSTAQCDADGKFQIVFPHPLPVDTLVFRQLGYKDKTLLIRNTDSSALTIVMERQVVTLDGVPVSAREADNIVHKAFARIPSNYPQKKTVYPALYRQVHKENGKYVRLIEAAVDINEPKYSTQRVFEANTGVHVNHIRRSGVYEDNGDDHGDHLVDLMEDNPVLYFFGTCLSPSAGKDVTFWIDTATMQRKDSVVVIGYSVHTLSDKRFEKGSIYINRPDMAILRIESRRIRNKDFPFQPNTGGHTWDLVDGGRVVQFHKIGHTYYMDSMCMWYTHDVRERNFPAKLWRVDETFSIWAGTPNISADAEDISFSVFSNLYHQHYVYAPSFWSSCYLLQHHPCDAAVVNDLSKSKPLQEQFSNEDL